VKVEWARSWGHSTLEETPVRQRALAASAADSILGVLFRGGGSPAGAAKGGGSTPDDPLDLLPVPRHEDVRTGQASGVRRVEAGTCGQGCRDAGGGQRQVLVAKAKMGEGRETQQGSGSLRGGAEPLVVVVVHSLARSYSLFHRPLHHSASTITCPQREIPSTRASQSCRYLFSLSSAQLRWCRSRRALEAC